MNRDLERLARDTFDVCVIGGGIHGAWIAWDAALRGLSVALVEKADFGSQTSANSLKIVHGGLRYLQKGDLLRMRHSIRERSILMRVAPHLVHPLPILIPLFGHGIRGPEAMRMALSITDAIGFDRNQDLDVDHQLPGGRIISAAECRARMPGLRPGNLTGGAIWFDAQMYDSERLTLAVVQSAAGAGAAVANYLEAISLTTTNGRISGVEVRDQLSDDRFRISARVVVNAAGPWAPSFSEQHGAATTARRFGISKALNLAIPRLFDGMAVGVPGRAGSSQASRMYFAVPWRDHTILGTAHLPYHGSVENFTISDDDVRGLIETFNAAYPQAGLTPADVIHVYPGMLPTLPSEAASGEVLVADHPLICREGSIDGPEGLITVAGVKYTTARAVAEQVVDATLMELRRRPVPCRTDHTALHGGAIHDLAAFLNDATQLMPTGIDAAMARHLALSYGTDWSSVIELVPNDDRQEERTLDRPTDVLRARVHHAVRHEMAQRLTDVVERRTDLGPRGGATSAIIDACANWMASELGWSTQRLAAEKETVGLRSLAAVT